MRNLDICKRCKKLIRETYRYGHEGREMEVEHGRTFCCVVDDLTLIGDMFNSDAWANRELPADCILRLEQVVSEGC